MQYLDKVCEPPIANALATPAFNIFLNNHPLLATIIHQIAREKHCKQSVELFIFKQKVLVLQLEKITLFYPILTQDNTYPSILKYEKNFFLMHMQPDNQKHQEFLFRFIREIYISYFESNQWITYHGNSILLPNNQAAIVLGQPKSGKTTLCAGLCLMAESAYLSDDRVMIKMNAQTRKVPTTTYLDYKAVYHFGIDNDLTNQHISIQSPRTQIPLSVINQIRNDASFANNHDNHQQKKPCPTYACPINIGLIIHAKFDPKLSTQYSLSSIANAKATELLQACCITQEEVWRDQYMDRGYDSPLSVQTLCTAQNQKLAHNITTLQLDYGPEVNYRHIEKTLLTQ
jgi:hypothetical protein